MVTNKINYFKEHSFGMLQACTEASEKTAKCGLVFRGIELMANIYCLPKVQALHKMAQGFFLLIGASYLIVQDGQKTNSFSKKLETSKERDCSKLNRACLYQLSQMEAKDVASCIKIIAIGLGGLGYSHFLFAPVIFKVWAVSRMSLFVLQSIKTS